MEINNFHSGVSIWIPAFAGMTLPGLKPGALLMVSRFRWNDTPRAKARSFLMVSWNYVPPKTKVWGFIVLNDN